MKKILILVALLFAASVSAQVTPSDLMGLGMPGELATKVAQVNQTMRFNDDVNRLMTFAASSDTAFTQKWGDGGTTATQDFTLSGSTADADDDSTLYLTGGGALGVSRGAFFRANGNEASSGGNVYMSTGNLAGADAIIRSNDLISLENNAGTAKWTIDVSNGFLRTDASITADIGWAAVAGANTACNTTCTSGCVAGYDIGTTALVSCNSALADSCICAGAS